MKRFSILLAALLLLVSAGGASAQHIVIKGGPSYNTLDLNDKVADVIGGFDVKNYTGYHVGIGYQTERTFLGFSLQPEIVYAAKGTKLGDDLKWEMKYVEVPVNIQWGPDLVAFRPFIQATPFVGYNVRSILKGSSSVEIPESLKQLAKEPDRFSYGIGLGGGVEVGRFQIGAKYYWNFGSVADIESVSQVWSKVKDIKTGTASGVELSIALLF